MWVVGDTTLDGANEKLALDGEWECRVVDGRFQTRGCRWSVRTVTHGRVGRDFADGFRPGNGSLQLGRDLEKGTSTLN